MNASPTHTHSLPSAADITRIELPNGVVILTRPNFNSPSVTLSGYLPAGSLFDPEEKLGLADFTASALLRGVEGRDFHHIHEALESAGASLGIGGGTHTAGFNGKALAEDLGLLLDLLSAALRRPVFPPTQVERLRAQFLTGLAIRAQDTGAQASLAFDRLVYAGHPYSRPEEGFPETVSAITRDDLAAFHNRCYGPRGMVLAVVGGVAPEQVVEQVSAAFGDWTNSAQPPVPLMPDLAPLKEFLEERISLPGKAQADLITGAAGPPRRSPDYMAVALGNSVLGQFGMMGRLGKSVREQAGLAYDVSSSVSGGMGPGAWYVAAGVDPQNVDQAVKLIREEIERFVSQPVSAEELADSQANFTGRLPLSLESNGGVAARLLSLERYGLGLDYYLHYADLVNAVTPDEILAAAQRYLDPSRLALAVAGL